MIAPDRPPGVSAPGIARSPWLRDLAVRRDRIPLGERTDQPEIEESFRVSFSDAVRSAAGSPVRDGALPREGIVPREGPMLRDAALPREAADPRLQRYRDIENM
ncbi:hypothetical protein OPU71_04695 [Niveibacterium sp. 24ML]|uniref:hypothetical protein n=1 Tax=Niveibacterium sp. 24ML TaxID=2985512 RepID=UPI00226F802D|nr:hypothetical protein [Niveibacterium sp. 24ML]MCX9155417.1 hypothetical protein [Niveibacterium sp. 24ML]